MTELIKQLKYVYSLAKKYAYKNRILTPKLDSGMDSELVLTLSLQLQELLDVQSTQLLNQREESTEQQISKLHHYGSWFKR